MCNISGAFHYMYTLYIIAVSLSFFGAKQLVLISFSLSFLAPTFFLFLVPMNCGQNVSVFAMILFAQTRKKHIHKQKECKSATRCKQKRNVLFYLDNYNQHQYLHDLHLKITNSASISIQNAHSKHWPCFASARVHIFPLFVLWQCLLVCSFLHIKNDLIFCCC